MNELDNLQISIYFKENSIPSLHRGVLSDESKVAIQALIDQAIAETKATYGHVQGRRINCLTGAEFYERFEKELHTLEDKGGHYYENVAAIKAAKRAAGLE